MLSSSPTWIDDNVTSLENIVPTLPPVIMPLQITCDCLRVLFGLLALASNGLMIAAFIRYQDFQTMSNIFLVNLCVVDCIAGLTNLNIPVIQYIADPDGILFKLHVDFAVLSSTGESTALFLIGIERYVHIVKWQRYTEIMTMERVVKVIIGFWILMALISVLFILKADLSKQGIITNFSSAGATLLGVSILGLLVLYTTIFRFATRKMSQSVQPIPSNTSECYRMFKKTAIVLAAYILFSIPSVISAILVSIEVLSPVFYVVYLININRVIYTCQTWINPIIYASKDKKLKAAFRKLLHIHDTMPTSGGISNVQVVTAGGSNSYNPSNLARNGNVSSENM